MISGSITTLNEERHIADCIRSLQQVCDEVIVVDSLSTDRTVEIAKACGARVISQEYLGDGPQKNVSRSHVKNDWILSLDADERLDDDAVATIRGLDLTRPTHHAYGFRKKNYIGDRWVRCAGLWPAFRGRLYHKQHVRWDDRKGHTKLDAKKVGLLPGHMLHYAYADYGEYLNKIFRYSRRGARLLHEGGKRTSAVGAVAHGAFTFFKNYFLRRGWMGGLDGLVVSVISAVGSFMKYAQLRELQRSHQGEEALSRARSRRTA